MLTESERKIYQLKDKIYKIFDSKNRDKIFTDYHFNFNKCLSEKQISKFESYYKVKLPEDYRNFLKIIGNGGKFHGGFSPGGRFQPLENSYPMRAIQKNIKTAFRKLRKPFPYTEDINKNMKIFESLDPDTKNVNKFNGYQGSLSIDSEPFSSGIILLEVTGKNPGRIWSCEEYFALDMCTNHWTLECICNDEAFFSLDNYNNHAIVKPISDSFYSWYDDWLDECFKKLEILSSTKDSISR